jgi:imidazole glycerol-phosphate synthase subunit HisH
MPPSAASPLADARSEEAARICVVDYGMGNMRSVEKALARAGADVARTADPGAARAAEGLVLPGVGAFPAGIERIRALGLDELLADRVAAGVPVLGICLGMQMLFERSSEHGGSEGLGLLAGEVSELRGEGRKLPHIGWEPVEIQPGSELFAGLDTRTPFYFVHSFAARPADRQTVVGSATWGERFAAAVESGPIYGVQFHPEKSSAAGLKLLENFARVCSRVAA